MADDDELLEDEVLLVESELLELPLVTGSRSSMIVELLELPDAPAPPGRRREAAGGPPAPPGPPCE